MEAAVQTVEVVVVQAVTVKASIHWLLVHIQLRLVLVVLQPQAMVGLE